MVVQAVSHVVSSPRCVPEADVDRKLFKIVPRRHANFCRDAKDGRCSRHRNKQARASAPAPPSRPNLNTNRQRPSLPARREASTGDKRTRTTNGTQEHESCAHRGDRCAAGGTGRDGESGPPVVLFVSLLRLFEELDLRRLVQRHVLCKRRNNRQRQEEGQDGEKEKGATLES